MELVQPLVASKKYAFIGVRALTDLAIRHPNSFKWEITIKVHRLNGIDSGRVVLQRSDGEGLLGNEAVPHGERKAEILRRQMCLRLEEGQSSDYRFRPEVSPVPATDGAAGATQRQHAIIEYSKVNDHRPFQYCNCPISSPPDCRTLLDFSRFGFVWRRSETNLIHINFRNDISINSLGTNSWNSSAD